MEDSILNKAIEISKRENKFSYFLVKTLFGEKSQKMGFLLYYFLRWIDDTIDSSQFTNNQKIRFLNNEKKIIENIFSGKQIKKLNEYEMGLSSLKNFGGKNAVKIKKYVIDNFIRAFELELKRTRIIKKSWLLKYTYYDAGSFANFFILMANPNFDVKIMKGISKTCASAADLAHLLRDFRKDIKNERINIPKEDIERFNIKINKLNGNCQELSNFTRNQVNQIYSLFSKGEKYIKSISSFKLRLALALLVSKYKFILVKIRKRHYNLFSDYDHSTLSEQIIRIVIILHNILKLSF